MEVEKISTLQYQEFENLIPKYILQIRSTLKNKHSLDVPVQCDEFIARCIRLKDGNVEKAIKLIQAFYAATEDFRDWDTTLLPSLHTDFYKTGMIAPLQKRDAEGRRIFIIRAELWNPNVTCFDTVIACIWMTAQFLTTNYLDAQHKGYVTIWDFHNFTLEQAWAVSHLKMLALAKWGQNGVVGRMKAFHMINHSRVINMIYAAIKPFLKEKLKKRIHFHGDEESLLKFVPANSLPTYLGGTEDPDKCVDTALINAIIDQDEYFQDMMNRRVPTK